MSSAAPPGGTRSSGGDYLLDSSVLIPSLRGDSAISARIDSLPQVYVSSIVLGELYFGAFGSLTRPADALSDIQAVEQKATVLAAVAMTALIYGRIGQGLKGKHLTMPENDVYGSPRPRFNTTSSSPPATRISTGSPACALSSGDISFAWPVVTRPEQDYPRLLQAATRHTITIRANQARHPTKGQRKATR